MMRSIDIEAWRRAPLSSDWPMSLRAVHTDGRVGRIASHEDRNVTEVFVEIIHPGQADRSNEYVTWPLIAVASIEGDDAVRE